ncbi:MAG: ABC transporter ATP-binding protein [Chloroflexota bacterium]
MIRLERIVKAYPMGKRQLVVLQGLNLEVGPGEMLAIMGPSGSGKSTMLNILGCLDRPTSGRYYLNGEDVSRLGRTQLGEVRARQVGFVFQSFNLLPRLSALDNVMLGMRYAGIHDARRAKEALARVGLAERAGHRPTELSGGEQQRVAIARALVKSPPLVLADEPTGNLDSRSSEEIMSIITTLHREQGNTLIAITHEEEVAQHCRRIVHLRDGQVVGDERV